MAHANPFLQVYSLQCSFCFQRRQRGTFIENRPCRLWRIDV